MSDAPEQPKTKELPAVPAWAVELTNATKAGFAETHAGFAETHARLDQQDQILHHVVTEGVETNTRLTRIEVRVESAEKSIEHLEGRVGRASTRVRENSQQDLAHEAKLAQTLVALAEEKAKREALEQNAATKDDIRALTEAQTSAIVEGVKLAAKNPTVQKILYAAAALVIVALNVATTYLTARSATPAKLQTTEVPK